MNLDFRPGGAGFGSQGDPFNWTDQPKTAPSGATKSSGGFLLSGLTPRANDDGPSGAKFNLVGCRLPTNETT